MNWEGPFNPNHARILCLPLHLTVLHGGPRTWFMFMVSLGWGCSSNRFPGLGSACWWHCPRWGPSAPALPAHGGQQPHGAPCHHPSPLPRPGWWVPVHPSGSQLASQSNQNPSPQYSLSKDVCTSGAVHLCHQSDQDMFSASLLLPLEF